LLLGIGVDSGIHLVHRANVEPDARAGLLGTTTARAVFYSAGTTIASFGALAFSSHRGIASLGVTLVIGMLFILLSTLVVLPALVEWRRPRPQADAVWRAAPSRSRLVRALHRD
jgi:predicted RND superfamily exporter protein